VSRSREVSKNSLIEPEGELCVLKNGRAERKCPGNKRRRREVTKKVVKEEKEKVRYPRGVHCLSEGSVTAAEEKRGDGRRLKSPNQGGQTTIFCTILSENPGMGPVEGRGERRKGEVFEDAGKGGKEISLTKKQNGGEPLYNSGSHEGKLKKSRKKNQEKEKSEQPVELEEACF